MTTVKTSAPSVSSLPLQATEDDSSRPPGEVGEARRSLPPPPPSRRPVPPPASGVHHQSSSSLPPPSHAPTPPIPEARPSRSLPSAPPRPSINARPSTAVSTRPRPTTSSSVDSTPRSTDTRDALRTLHERELDRIHAEHRTAIESLTNRYEVALEELRRRHARELESIETKRQIALAQEQEERKRLMVAARRRVAVAANMALEDRQGLLRHLEEENDTLRERVHELEGRLGLDPTPFSERPRAPSLPPEMFGTQSLLPAPLDDPNSPASDPDDGVQVPAAEDDLTRLRGIGPAIARSLREAGVVSFEQIAAWSDEDIKNIAPRLRRRPNRIRKDGWVSSARELLLELGRQR